MATMMTMMTMQRQEPATMPEYRLSDSETMQNKLTYQIRTGNLGIGDLDRLQQQCTSELHQLRSELDDLLRELRVISDRLGGRDNRFSIAA
ncbi:hypothetical protein [Cohnella panacarvi]|uniref:hypothetical protein n=1 Tax=Cohnella panacarvi TaxID=400776 RepID=UPI00047ACC0E|nr:hypothetical protein [Cohnella panacarvi]